MDTYDFFADPRTPSLPERQALHQHFAREQGWWLSHLQELVEAPPLASDFPAFLLATPPFGDLSQRIRGVSRRQDLPAAVADELDWFVRAFADYLRSVEGEDVFDETPRLTG